MTQINRTFYFAAGHRLPNHNGKCRRLHGHTYRVDVALAGNPDENEGASSQGMVMDFNHIQTLWKEYNDSRLDHRTFLWNKDPLVEGLQKAGFDLLELGIELLDSPPTAEYLAEVLYINLWQQLGGADADVILLGVRIWESNETWALFDGTRMARLGYIAVEGGTSETGAERSPSGTRLN